MKYLFITAAFLLAAAPTANAHEYNKNTAVEIQKTNGTQYAMLVQNEKSLRSAIMTASEMKTDNQNIQFEIVIMGAVVQQLNNQELLPELQKANTLGIKLVVCEFALKVFGLELKNLPSFLIGTPNAHKYMFLLQEKKYNTLSI